MIAITAYTEPQPVQTTVSDPQQIHELEEDAPKEFASLLAGLLHKNESPEIPEVSLDGISDIEIDFNGLLNGKETTFGSFANLAVNEELAGVNLSEEQSGNLLNLNHLFTASDETQTDLLSEISNMSMEGLEALVMDASSAKHAKNQEMSKETGQKTDFIVGKKEDTALADKIAANSEASLKQQNEKLSGESVNKKDRAVNESALSKNEKIETSAFSSSRSEEAASLQKKPESDNRAVINETRGRSRRDRLNIEVRDMRTAEAGANNSQARTFSAVETAAGRVASEAPVREITLDLRLPDYNGGSGSMGQNAAQTAWETKAGASLESMLARELHQSFNGDIVRHASMALRDGGSATIKLALHPETLGNVKIQLEMTDNKITGHIVIESVEALNAFRKELSALEQAFRDSGFENAELNLSLAADGNSEEQRQEAGSFTQQMIASRYEDSFATDGEYDGAQMINVYFERKNGSINMLA